MFCKTEALLMLFIDSSNFLSSVLILQYMEKHLSAALFRLNGGYCSLIFQLEVVVLCDVREYQLTTPLPTERHVSGLQLMKTPNSKLEYCEKVFISCKP